MLIPQVSILISSFERVSLFKRTLYSIEKNAPPLSEVIIAEEEGKESILPELKKFNFPYKFILVNMKEFEEKTRIKKFHNNPSLTNNIAFKHSSGNLIFQMGNECIAWDNCFNQMINDVQTNSPLMSPHFINFSTTYNIPENILRLIGESGQHLNIGMVNYCRPWPLQDNTYHSDVTNYISLTSRKVWEELNGYDERYLAGIACEDSDFVRRMKLLKDFCVIRSAAVSLHQEHGGMTRYKNPVERQMNMDKWNDGLAINRSLYHSWDGKTIKNQQPWPIGTYGIKDIVIKNYE